MTRRIVLELGAETTDTECGDCPAYSNDGWRARCCRLEETIWDEGQRLPECRAAKQPAKEPDDAAG
jgi:hypothetical protein